MANNEILQMLLDANKNLLRQFDKMKEDFHRVTQLQKLQEERMQLLFLMVQVSISRSEKGLSWDEVKWMEQELSRSIDSAEQLEESYNNRILNYEQEQD